MSRLCLAFFPEWTAAQERLVIGDLWLATGQMTSGRGTQDRGVKQTEESAPSQASLTDTECPGGLPHRTERIVALENS